MTKRISVIFCLMGLLLIFAPVCADAQQRDFPFPAVPSELRTPQARAGYLINHYWDNFNFNDEANFKDADFFEQGFSNFISLFPIVDTPVLTDGVATLVERAAPKIKLLSSVVDKYLFEPDSPIYNEEYFHIFAGNLAKSAALDEAAASDYVFYNRLLSLNAPGKKAADFTFKTLDGKRHRLSSFKAKKLLMIFYDPECEHCMELMSKLAADSEIAARVAEGALSVLAVFADGNEPGVPGGQTAILNKLKELPFPAPWTRALDVTGIQEQGLYWLHTLPALYLLDSHKIVIAKHFTLEQLQVLL